MLCLIYVMVTRLQADVCAADHCNRQ